MTKQSRLTKQKELITKKLHEFNHLFSAEELFEKARKEDKSIGMATIYRFLKDSSKQEHIHSYNCNRRKIYSTKTNNHCHFICEKCGKIEHINISEVGFLKQKVRGDICHFQIDLTGVCEKCRKK